MEKFKIPTSAISKMAVSPAGERYAQQSRFAVAQQKQQRKQNRIKRQKEILAEITAQRSDIDFGAVEIMRQFPGQWFRGITRDYLDFAVNNALKFTPNADIYVYRTDEMLVEPSHSLTGETFPAYDISVNLTDKARSAFINTAKGIGTIADQVALVQQGYDGCACSYFASRYVKTALLEKYGDRSPDTIAIRPIFYLYRDGEAVERACLDTKQCGQGSGVGAVHSNIARISEYERRIFSEIIQCEIWD